MHDLSSYIQTLEKKSIAVFGLGLSGLSVVKALLSANATVTAWDDKVENRDKAQAMGAQITDLTTADLSIYDFLVLAPGVPYTYEPHAVVLNAQKYNLEIIGDLELLHRSGHNIKTVGITGTNGKSTTTALLTHVLNHCGKRAVMGGNIGKAVFDLDLNNLDVLVLEISSYQMDLCPTYRPDISMLLNITHDHLDRHGSMQDYVRAKERILDGQGVAIVSIDDDYTLALFDKLFIKGNRRVIPVSVRNSIPEGLFVQDNILIENKQGEDRKIGSLNGLETLRGLHNYQNCAFVYAAAHQMGLADADIMNAFKTYPGLPHRQYLVATYNDVAYVNDSKATNAEAAAKALSSYDNIFWIIGGRAKSDGLEGLEIFKDKIIKTYVIGEATERFSLWLTEYDFPFEVCGTLDNALESAHQAAQNHGGQATVLLSPACASWDQYASFEERGNNFANKVLELTGKS